MYLISLLNNIGVSFKMFYKFENTFFVSAHDYLLKSFKFDLQQNQLVDLTIGSPTFFVNFYNLIPKLTIKALLPRIMVVWNLLLLQSLMALLEVTRII